MAWACARAVAAVGLAVLSLAWAPALGQDSSAAAGPDDPRIDAATGRDKRVWPPSPMFDYLHLRLDMDVPTMAEPKFNATATLLMEAVGTARDAVRLNAGPGLTFSRATVNGRAATFERTEGLVTVRLDPPARPGSPVTVVLAYSANKPGGGGAGLTWSKDDKDSPEEDFMFHSQGQPESNRLWFPSHDFPNDRLATEICVTVPEGYTAVSNGRLVSVAKVAGRDGGPGRTRFHWLQAQPHPTYLVSLVIGKFDMVEVGGPESAYPGLWMPVYGPLGSGEAIRGIFASTPEMVKLFEDLLDEKYPWDKYAQVIARDFNFGAMENTSASTFAPQFAMGRPGSADAIIAHELLHQWLGDLLTCRSWEHLWLNEGWASLGEALWAEHKGGAQAYQRTMMRFIAQERGMSAETAAPRSNAMVSHRYTNPDQRFFAPNNVYSKGACVLHMLRQRLGDETFWKGVRLYVDRHRFDQVETDDFRNAMEEASGQSLERFFEQWCYRPGLPRLSVSYTYDDVRQRLTIVVEQTQRIDADNPAYALSIPVYLEWKAQEDSASPASNRYVYVDTNVRRIEASFSMDRAPDQVIVDPFASNLAILDVKKPVGMWIEQLEQGPTEFARADAAAALGGVADPAAAAALARAAADERLGDEVRAIAQGGLERQRARVAAMVDGVLGAELVRRAGAWAGMARGVGVGGGLTTTERAR